MTKLLTLSLSLFAAVSSPALSQAPQAESRIVVTTADLDLASAAGQRSLDRRLAGAVAEACGSASVVDLAGQNEVRRCQVDTSARIAADRDRLVELASRGGTIVLAAR